MDFSAVLPESCAHIYKMNLSLDLIGLPQTASDKRQNFRFLLQKCGSHALLLKNVEF
jgi:hypothetical protein